MQAPALLQVVAVAGVAVVVRASSCARHCSASRSRHEIWSAHDELASSQPVGSVKASMIECTGRPAAISSAGGRSTVSACTRVTRERPACTALSNSRSICCGAARRGGPLVGCCGSGQEAHTAVGLHQDTAVPGQRWRCRQSSNYHREVVQWWAHWANHLHEAHALLHPLPRFVPVPARCTATITW